MLHPVIDGVWVGLEKEQRSNTIAKQGQLLKNYLNKSTLISKEDALWNFAWYLPPQGTLPSPTLQRGDPEVAVEPRSPEQLQFFWQWQFLQFEGKVSSVDSGGNPLIFGEERREGRKCSVLIWILCYDFAWYLKVPYNWRWDWSAC